jgi:hypothetical protein
LVRLFFQILYSVGQIPGERNRHHFLVSVQQPRAFRSGSV